VLVELERPVAAVVDLPVDDVALEVAKLDSFLVCQLRRLLLQL